MCLKVLFTEMACPCIHGGRGVPHPSPLGELTVPQAHPLNDDLQGDDRFRLVWGVAFGVVFGDGLGVVFGVVPGVVFGVVPGVVFEVVPGVRESSSGIPGGYAGSSQPAISSCR